jgi:hypothetical protein
MTFAEAIEPPLGYMWVEDLAVKSHQDVNTIISLCEQEYIQGVKLDGHWAVRVVKTTTTQAGSAIVRDLKAGGDISIGAVIGQYVTFHDGKNREKDRKQFVSQEPIRSVIDEARKWIKWSWYALAGGLMLLFAFIIITWPIAAFLIIPGVTVSKRALELAQNQGDGALIEEATSIHNQAVIMAVVLWGVLFVIALIGLGSLA